MIPLQAFNMSTCAWDLAESTDDAITDFIIFVGDTVQHITAKYYRALLHRVVKFERLCYSLLLILYMILFPQGGRVRLERT